MANDTTESQIAQLNTEYERAAAWYERADDPGEAKRARARMRYLRELYLKLVQSHQK